MKQIGRPGRLARYHLYGIAGNPAAPRITLREREYHPESDSFREVGTPDGVMLTR